MFNTLFTLDWTYFVFIIPCILISAIASVKVNATFNKYSQITNSRNLTGAQAAQSVLNNNGVSGVTIERTAGNLTDHFDPRQNVIRLSDTVYDQTTVAAVGVAAHEAGHAVQHAKDYLPNKIRGAIIPMVNIGSSLGWVLIIIGLFLPTQYSTVLKLGIILYSAAVVFTLVTLPVEFNASRRALNSIKATQILDENEYEGAKKTLQAAAMTYVAAALTSIAQLARIIFIAGSRQNRD